MLRLKFALQKGREDTLSRVSLACVEHFVSGFECCVFLSFSRLQDDPPAGVSGAPSENNIMIWNAVIFG